MSNTKSIEIKCTHCNNWFPSPIFIGDMNTFDTSMLIGNIVQCPHCSKMTGCNKENMAVRSEDGGFRGKDI